jgi:hypothetical protein
MTCGGCVTRSGWTSRWCSEAAAVARRTYADETGDYQAEFNRVCYPLYSATPGWAGESRQFLARMIKNMDVSLHYASQRTSGFDPRSVTGAVRCPVLVGQAGGSRRERRYSAGG